MGPSGTKVELVFASKRDNRNIIVQLFRMPKEKGTAVEFTPNFLVKNRFVQDAEGEGTAVAFTPNFLVKNRFSKRTHFSGVRRVCPSAGTPL